MRRGVALEINASPERLDLHGTLIRTAKAKGAKFTISTDAHHPKHLANMRYGVVTARRGWLGAFDGGRSEQDQLSGGQASPLTTLAHRHPADHLAGGTKPTRREK